MTFEDKMNKVLKEHAVNKKALAREIGMSYTTFLYKCKGAKYWNVIEFKKLSNVLRLSDEEQAFLCEEVT